MHIVAAPRFENDGTRFKATHFEQNLYASADAWSDVVVAETGPDGAVWLADWYCPVLNHNVYRPGHQKRGAGNAYVTPDRDREHGRIYRVLPKGAKVKAFPALKTSTDRVKALSHDDLFWRLTAQRLLVQSSRAVNDSIINKLIALAEADKGSPSLHALHTLDGLLKEDDARLQQVATALTNSPDRGTAVAALSILPNTANQSALFLDVLNNRDRHAMIRKAAALALVELSPDPNIGAELVALVNDDPELVDHLGTAVRLACLRHPEAFIRVVLADGSAPKNSLLKRTFKEALKILVQDKQYLSPGLLALARHSSTDAGRRITKAAGTAPPTVLATNLSDSAKRGRNLYLMCIACHQPNGGGVPGAFPALAGSPRVLGPPEVLIKILLKGIKGPLESQGRRYNGVMPGHEAAFTDRQVADVLSYIRGSWNNNAGDISESVVHDIRAAIKDRHTPWSAKEL